MNGPGAVAVETTRATLRAIVYNPTSGARPSAGLVASVAEMFRAEGDVLVLPTQRQGHAAVLVEELLRGRPQELTDVLALGGDGTLNEALFGAWRAGAFAPGGPSVRAGILPAGSTNVVARSLGIPRDPVRAAARLIAGGMSQLDLGLCRNESGTRPFLLACGVGYDAEVALDISPRLKRLLGRHAYFVQALGATGERERGLVAEWERADGSRGTAEAGSIIIGNCPLYAGIVRLRRQASFQDALLDLALLRSTGLVPLVSAAISGILTDLASSRRVVVEPARSVRVRAGRPIAVHVDAEPMGTTPVEVEVLAGALSFRIP